MQLEMTAGQGRAAFAAGGRPAHPRWRQGRAATVRVQASQEHVRWISEVACVPGRPAVEPLLRVLEAQGQAAVSPADRGGLHPLLIPLAAASGSGQPITCLLRTVGEGQGAMPLPVVAMERNGSHVMLLARSIDEYLKRALAEEDAAGGPGVVTAAAGGNATALYAPGAFAASGSPSLAAFLTRKVGIFPDVAEGLVQAHEAKGDTMSALITSEWYMRKEHLLGWGRPFEFACELLSRVGRGEEARDVARLALRMPWATFAHGYAPLRDLAGLQGGSAEIRAALADQDEMSTMPSGLRTAVKTEQERYLDDALWLLNQAAAGERTWDDVRDGVAAMYNEAGLRDVAGFIMHA